MPREKEVKNILTERQRVVVEVIKMRLTNEQALQYLERNGYKISQSTLTREKRYVESKKLERLFEIAKIGFENQHIDRIDNTEIALKLMWNNYHAETTPYRRVIILEKIVAIQPYLSSFYEASKNVIENDPKIKMQWEAHLNHLREQKEQALRLKDLEEQKIQISQGNNKSGENVTITDNNHNGVQSLNKQPEQDNSSISSDGTEETTAGEGSNKEQDEARYRRLKEGFVF